MSSRPTIGDVALRAGVSAATVSNALTGRANVSEQSRAAIMKAVTELDYRPSLIARSLRRGRTGVLAMILGNIQSPFDAAMAHVVEEAAREHGYSVILCNTDHKTGQVQRYVGLLRDKLADGAIILSRTTDDDGLLRECQQEGLAFVCLNRSELDRSVPYVAADNRGGAREVVEHLVGLGHRRIALILGARNSVASIDRLKGFNEGMQAAGLPIEDRMLLEGDYTLDGGYQATKRLFKRGLRPSAIFAANDVMAFGAMQAAMEVGLQVPGDLSVVGFDDIDLAAFPLISLTTVRQPRRQMGRMAVGVVAKMIGGASPARAPEITLEVNLVVRHTTTSPRLISEQGSV